MRLSRWIVISLLCLLLQACTSTVMMEQMQSGKGSFVDGDFKKAFHQLLPVAAYGRPEAQYAVGYMYYYGYGVSRDSESGLFWMNKAASQHFGPAIKALMLIRRGAPVCGEVEADYSGDVRSYKDDPLAQKNRALQPHACDANRMPIDRTNLRPMPTAASSTRWSAPESVPRPPLPRIAQNDADAYALQLYGAFKLAHVKNVQAELNLRSDTRIWHTKNRSKDWFVLTYGSYPSIADARLARDDLPPAVSDLDPWVRKLNNLEHA